MAGKSVRYCCARPTFDSPWYQMTPRIVYGMSGAIMALNFSDDFGLFARSLVALCASRASLLVQCSAGVLPQEVWISPTGTPRAFCKSRPK
jgi:hypothetical protein